MKTKLTLRLDQEAIESAKDYAERRGISVSKLVEQFFLAITTDSASEVGHISPFIESLRGILPAEGTEEDYRRHLESKYR
ncbi:MAG: DUF6364 family protein [Bradymonadaceae bacterium]